MSQRSAMIDDIMQGKAVNDVMEQRGKDEIKAFAYDTIDKMFRGSIKEDYETASNYSERID